MLRKLNYATRNLLFVRGRASRFLRSFDSLRRGDKVVLCCRKSHRDRSGSNSDQDANLRNTASQAGILVVDVEWREGPGSDPWWLARAVAKARQHGATALLAEVTSRFIRHPEYSPTIRWKRELQPSQQELDDLRWWTKGFRLVTHLHPDATPNEERAYQTRRQAIHKRGGGDRKPGYKKRRRERLLAKVITLRRQRKTYEEIEKATGIPRTTVCRWVGR